MKDKCDIREILQHKGVEPTAHRLKVLRVISDTDKALMPKDILKKLRHASDFDKVTLYRILDLFVAKKILRRLTSVDGNSCYEIICQEHNPTHAHFICRCCGVMKCLEGIDLGQLQSTIKRQIKLKHETLDLKLEGLCAACEKGEA